MTIDTYLLFHLSMIHLRAADHGNGLQQIFGFSCEIKRKIGKIAAFTSMGTISIPFCSTNQYLPCV